MTDAITATRGEVADLSTKCYLLDLPGELRNRIYGYIQDDDPATYFARRLKPYSDEVIERYGIYKRIPDFFGLTQACRQLRQENLPLYAATAKIRVCHVDLEEFFQMRFPLLGRGKDGKVTGDLTIDCFTITPEGSTAPEEEPRLDIAPILTCCRENPGLRVQCGYTECICTDCDISWTSVKRDLHQLFEIAQEPSRQDWLVKTIVELKVSCNSKIRVTLKKDDGADPTMERWYPGEECPEFHNFETKSGMRFGRRAFQMIEGADEDCLL